MSTDGGFLKMTLYIPGREEVQAAIPFQGGIADEILTSGDPSVMVAFLAEACSEAMVDFVKSNGAPPPRKVQVA